MSLRMGQRYGSKIDNKGKSVTATQNFGFTATFCAKQTYFAKAHLIGQNPIDSVIMQLDQPIETLQLVLVHLANGSEIRGLVVQANDAAFGFCRFQEDGVLFCLCHAALFAPRSLFAFFGGSSDGTW